MQKAMKYLLIKLNLVGYYNPAYKGYKAFNLIATYSLDQLYEI